MRRMVCGLVVVLALAGCGGGDGEAADDIDLEVADQDEGTGTDAADEPAPNEAPVDGDGNTAGTGDETPDTGTLEDEPADAHPDTDTTQPDGAEDTTADLVDLTEAVPGTWPVGDAGTVTFSIRDGALALDEVTPADGWDYFIDEQDAEEIEVDFRRDDEQWEIEIELDDGRTTLEVEIRRDIRDAQPGSYDLGEAGTFTFAVEGGVLHLTDLTPADGWSVTEQEEESDSIDLELRADNREVDVEVERDDGRIELEIDLKVVGPVTD